MKINKYHKISLGKKNPPSMRFEHGSQASNATKQTTTPWDNLNCLLDIKTNQSYSVGVGKKREKNSVSKITILSQNVLFCLKNQYFVSKNYYSCQKLEILQSKNEHLTNIRDKKYEMICAFLAMEQ